MSEKEELMKTIQELMNASAVIEEIRANDVLAGRIARLGQLLRKGAVANNCNCNCSSNPFDRMFESR